MFDWFFGDMWSALLHWLAYWGAFIAVVGFGVLGFLYSPWFKTAFAGIAVGAVALTMGQYGLISFRQKEPSICQNPAADPAGPIKRCWHSTDDSQRYGYWGDCDA